MPARNNVLEKVGGNWSLWFSLEPRGQSERITFLNEMVVVFARTVADRPSMPKEHEWADGELLKYLEYLFCAIEDEAVSSAGDTEEASRVRGALEAADRRKAVFAKDLFKAIPHTGKGVTREWIAEDETRKGERQVPVFPKTLARILGEIARQWEQTKDETEADELFNYLLEVAISPTEFRGVVQKAVRDRDALTPIARVERHLRTIGDRQIAKSSFDLSGLFPVLFSGWAKRVGLDSFREPTATGLLGVVRELGKGASVVAWDATILTARELAKADKSARSLLTHLSPPYGTGGEVTSVGIMRATVSFYVTRPDYLRRMSPEEYVTREFGVLVKKAESWVNPHHPEVTVRLEVVEKERDGWEPDDQIRWKYGVRLPKDIRGLPPKPELTEK
ncbi:hypothetical protein EPN83_00820 [Patescibacteria group bacterium]|nr:MAG: hypothetical protein EPN83_00820 [Patescibacteria group bacterium]